MLKLLSGVSIAALLAIAPAAAQTTPPATTPPSTTQDRVPADKSPSMVQDKSPSTTAPSVQSGTQPATQDAASAVTLTEDQAKEWVDKPVFSSDGKEIGEVYEFKRTADNKVTELHADIGGFLGMGETRVKLAPSEFKLQGDRVVLNITEEQAKALPKVEK
jgi:hypothetical protein